MQDILSTESGVTQRCEADDMRYLTGASRVGRVIASGVKARRMLAGVALAALLVLAVLAPIPPLMLDLLLALSLGAAAGILLVALTASDPLQLTSMPPMLVLTGLVRIVLCVSVSRMILMGGGDGTLVASLGVVAGGADVIASVALLVVLAVVHLVMVTGGVGRMAEVAARFALDAIPGKQMGLDTAVGAGQLSAEAAGSELRRLEAEAGFYGAMDGAARLLRGEAVATIAIVAITAVAGASRAVSGGMGPGEVASHYAMMATGQGLVSLLPALVMAAGAALMVSRSAGRSPLVEEVGEQMLGGPWPLIAAAIVLIGLGLFPGVAKLPTLAGGGLLLLAAMLLLRNDAYRLCAGDARDGEARPSSELTIELGMGLLVLAEQPTGGLMKLLPPMRSALSRELGFEVPPATVTDSLDLGATEFAVTYRVGRISAGSVRPGRVLAVAPHAGAYPDEGSPGQLADGRTGVWTLPERASALADAGFALMTPEQALVDHLRTALRRHGHRLLDLERAAALMEQTRRNRPALASAAEKAGVTQNLFRAVCRELLRQGVPLRDPVSVLESILEALPETTDAEQLALRARPALAGMLSRHLMTDDRIRAVTLARELHEELADAGFREDGRTVAAMMPARQEAWLELLEQIGIEHGWGRPVAMIAEQRSLLVLQSLCGKVPPWLLAVRASELAPDAEMHYVAAIEAAQLG